VLALKKDASSMTCCPEEYFIACKNWNELMRVDFLDKSKSDGGGIFCTHL